MYHSPRGIALLSGRVPPASLDLNFLAGLLDSSITFTRAAGPATYFDATGTLQTAGTNVARFDTDPATLAPRGLLIEEARTNALLYSADQSNATFWSNGSAGGATNPTVTGAAAVAPDGTTTATSLVFPAVSGAGKASIRYQSLTATAAVYTFSVWLRGAAGGEQVYIEVENNVTFYSAARITLSTAWQRYSLTTSALTAATWSCAIGTDLRDVAQTSTAGGTVYSWGAQLEAGAFATSYIPTTGAAATRAVDVPTSVDTGWLASGAGTAVMTATTLAGVAANVSQAGDGSHLNPAASLFTATPNGRYRHIRYWQQALSASQLAAALAQR